MPLQRSVLAFSAVLVALLVGATAAAGAAPGARAWHELPAGAVATFVLG